MPLDWDKLRVFHAVAEAGSFTHAGDTLNLSQSAVSRTSRRLCLAGRHGLRQDHRAAMPQPHGNLHMPVSSATRKSRNTATRFEFRISSGYTKKASILGVFSSGSTGTSSARSSPM